MKIQERPAQMQFRADGRQLMGVDPSTGQNYRIGWCGNGQYSHYVLRHDEDPEKYRYVYVNEKDELYRSIYAAEMRLIYKVATP